MIIKEVKLEDKKAFNALALHPLQSWEWGEFRKKTGIEVVRLGKYQKGKLVETAQLTIHPLPFTCLTIGYFPKGNIPSKEMLEELIEIGKIYNCIFIKLEPNIPINSSQFSVLSSKSFLRHSPHPLFTKYTFQLDLTKSEDELLKSMHPKTRYNTKVAQKHGVVVKEDNSEEAFNTYLDLLSQTTRRQKFYAHDRQYHQFMWETLKVKSPNDNKLTAHLLVARYQPPTSKHPVTLVSWIVFLFNNILYYPYGASSDQFKNVMASNLMMWEAIHFGKKHHASIFDMWGAIGPDPKPTDPWYGFHRFKQGYNPRLVEFAGSFDLVINPFLYHLYNTVHYLRQFFLRIKSNLSNS